MVSEINNNLAYSATSISNSEYLNTNIVFMKSGSIKQIYYASTFIKAIANGVGVTLGTIPDGYRPNASRNYLITIRGEGTNLVIAQLTLTNTGILDIKPLYGSIAAGGWYFIDKVYM